MRLSLDWVPLHWHHDAVQPTNPIVRALDDAGYRITGPRRALADLALDLDGHFTAAELADASRKRGLRVGRATLFRALEVMIELGVVERLDLPSGEHAYVVCAAAHHHHVVCSVCGRTAEVDDLGLADAVRRIELQSGFQIDTHRLEMFGRCRRCQARQRADAATA